MRFINKCVVTMLGITLVFAAGSLHATPPTPISLSGAKSPATSADTAEAPAAAKESHSDMTGIWGSEYGEIYFKQDGDAVEGLMAKPNGLCPFKTGEKLFVGKMMEDSLSGKFLMCPLDSECGASFWTRALLLAGKQGTVLSGSSYSTETKCMMAGHLKSPDGGKNGLYFRKLANDSAAVPQVVKSPAENGKSSTVSAPTSSIPMLPGPPAAPGTYDPRAAIKSSSVEANKLKLGKGLLEAGQFEQARAAFEEVLRTDPGQPNALVGIGVTHYARHEYEKALEFYKKALAEDPNYGMAYYNMACIYALQKKTDLAFKYLKLSLFLGFESKDAMDRDADLESLRSLPGYKDLQRDDW